MEAQAKVEQRGSKEGLHLPREDLRSPRPLQSPRRPYWDKKTFQ